MKKDTEKVLPERVDIKIWPDFWSWKETLMDFKCSCKAGFQLKTSSNYRNWKVCWNVICNWKTVQIFSAICDKILWEPESFEKRIICWTALKRPVQQQLLSGLEQSHCLAPNGTIKAFRVRSMLYTAVKHQYPACPKGKRPIQLSPLSITVPFPKRLTRTTGNHFWIPGVRTPNERATGIPGPETVSRKERGNWSRLSNANIHPVGNAALFAWSSGRWIDPGRQTQMF